MKNWEGPFGKTPADSTTSPAETDNKAGEREKKIARFVHEAGQLKRVDRSGWWVAGIKHPESVADHSHRASLIALFLAKELGADVEKALTLAVLHDLPEARINDLHKVVQSYVDLPAAQDKAARDQAAALPPPLAALVLSAHEEMDQNQSLEARIAKDADLLECLFQAREYLELGYPVQDWIDNAQKGLATQPARKIAQAALAIKTTDWWKNLKKK